VPHEEELLFEEEELLEELLLEEEELLEELLLEELELRLDLKEEPPPGRASESFVMLNGIARDTRKNRDTRAILSLLFIMTPPSR
jgi:hypothetical protein